MNNKALTQMRVMQHIVGKANDHEE